MTKPIQRFAENTDVSVERSEAELKGLLVKHGAIRVGTLMDTDATVVVFEMNGRRIRQDVKHPNPEDYQENPKGQQRTEAQIKAAVDQELRRRWRAIVLITKAKLEMIAAGMGSFEAEFMAQTVLANGETVGEQLLPRIAKVYNSGTMPSLMLGSGSK